MIEVNRERRDAFDMEIAHHVRSLAALESLREDRRIPKDLNSGHGLEWLLSQGPKPLVDVRCTRGHKLGGVWRTPAGGVFASWPEVSSRREGRTRPWIMTGPRRSRRRMIVDLLAEQDSFATDARLEVSCDCRGLRSMPSGTRQRLVTAYRLALAGRPVRFDVDEPKT